MRNIQVLIVLVCSLLVCNVYAASAAGERYINMLTQGGPTSIRDAAKSIYHTGEKDIEVLDVAAEVLLKNQRDSSSNTMVDALAWVSKALGQSGNPRYKSVLQEVVQNSHRKVAKHAKKALRSLSGDAKQYQAGSVNLEAASKKAAANTKAQTAKLAKKMKAQGKASIADISKGMSREEVYSLMGQPTAVSSHQTGKAWIPFNFKGADVVRSNAFYKGQGRIVFSQDSVYSQNFRVLEVHINPNESGYP